MKFRHLFLVVMTIILATTVLSCKNDKDEPEMPPVVTPTEETTLSVSPASLSMLSEKGASVSFTIRCNSNWNILNVPEWINLSATSGSGDATITVSALSQNDDDETRTATVTITASEKSAEVKIEQLPAFVSNCTVTFTDFLSMTTSVAFKYQIGPKVSYFYAGYLDVSAAGWTDEKIVQKLTSEDSFDSKNNETTGLQGFGGMDPDTEYYLCSIAFNEKGERGNLIKTRIKTLADKTEVPRVWIENVEYNDTQWVWETTKNVYTTKYYQFCTDGTPALIFNYLFTEAEIAWLIKSLVDSGEKSPIANGGSWRMDRDKDAEDVFIATWGVDVDNN